jgi:vibriolysin
VDLDALTNTGGTYFMGDSRMSYDLSNGFTAPVVQSLSADLTQSMGLGSAMGLVPQDSWLDALGGKHLRFEQFWNGYPVIGGDILVHIREGESIPEFSGLLGVDSVPAAESSVTAASARQIALGAVEGDILTVTTPSFCYVVCDTGSHGQEVRFAHQVYVDVRQSGIRNQYQVYVDAQSGEVLMAIPLIHELMNREVYNWHGSNDMWEDITPDLDRSEGSIPAADPVVNKAYINAGITDAFYSEVFCLGSWNLGVSPANLRIEVNYGPNMNNACYAGGMVRFGDGDGVKYLNFGYSLDIMVHEISHGVTEHSSALYYWGESGALNETFSDVMSSACSFWIHDWGYFPLCWNLAEDIYTPGIYGDAMRYINNPSRTVSYTHVPDHYSERYTGRYDAAGVHVNSGISNVVYYLLGEGGYHPTENSWVMVQPVGMEAAAHLYFQTVVGERVPSKATFRQFAEAMGKVAWKMLGWSGWCNVYTAWFAVGVHDGLFGEMTLSDGSIAWKTGDQLTYIGNVWFYDGENANVVWATNLSGYAYMFPENTDTGGYYFWLYGPGKYVWTSAEVYPKYWDYSTNSYKTAIDDGVLK